MVISHEHRYLFIEIPQTASWAIRIELCESYGGEPIMHKHASYPEFRRSASADEKNYFAFASIRNPLDNVVSGFFKLRTNHKGAFTAPDVNNATASDRSSRNRFRFVQETNADFETYFRRYHGRPYGNMIDVSAIDLDFVIRYERLQEDFSEVLCRLGLNQVRPIPTRNKTQERGSDWQSYYTTASYDQAKRKFGPFMRRWEYDFPPKWGPVDVSVPDEIVFRSLARARRLYLTSFRYNPGFTGRMARYLRHILFE